MRMNVNELVAKLLAREFSDIVTRKRSKRIIWHNFQARCQGNKITFGDAWNWRKLLMWKKKGDKPCQKPVREAGQTKPTSHAANTGRTRSKISSSVPIASICKQWIPWTQQQIVALSHEVQWATWIFLSHGAQYYINFINEFYECARIITSCRNTNPTMTLIYQMKMEMLRQNTVLLCTGKRKLAP